MAQSNPNEAETPRDSVHELLGPHPPRGLFSDYLLHRDGETKSSIPHRSLTEREEARANAVRELQTMLVRHHASDATHARIAELRELYRREGIPVETAEHAFPRDPSTRKGNFAEIVLAEYITAASGAGVPVYRLRHNPNVDSSMKGDDVLAFDLDADPVRIIVGEAKYRATSTGAVVEEIILALQKSHERQLPMSLSFVAEHCDAALGARIHACARLFAEKRLRIDYVGMLVSDSRATARVDEHAAGSLRRLVLLSWGLRDPETIINACFAGLE